jgi:heat shock protein HslJ
MNQYKKIAPCLCTFVLFIFVTGCATKSESDPKIMAQTNIKQALQEVQWQLEAYKHQDNWVNNVGTKRIYIIFKNDTQLNGFAGCNRLFTKYTTTDNLLSISPIRTTRKFCHSPDNTIMQAELNFLALMGKVATYTVDSETLTLFNEQGERMLIFKRKAE